MENDTKFVDFANYCRTCAHERKEENDEPCDECLNVPVRENTSKPVNWKERDKT